MAIGPAELTDDELEALCRWYAGTIGQTYMNTGATVNTATVAQMNARLAVLQTARRDLLAADAATVEQNQIDRPSPPTPPGPG